MQDMSAGLSGSQGPTSLHPPQHHACRRVEHATSQLHLNLFKPQGTVPPLLNKGLLCISTGVWLAGSRQRRRSLMPCAWILLRDPYHIPCTPFTRPPGGLAGCWVHLPA
jgi:hypothetical protein